MFQDASGQWVMRTLSLDLIDEETAQREKELKRLKSAALYKFFAFYLEQIKRATEMKAPLKNVKGNPWSCCNYLALQGEIAACVLGISKISAPVKVCWKTWWLDSQKNPQNISSSFKWLHSTIECIKECHASEKNVNLWMNEYGTRPKDDVCALTRWGCAGFIISHRSKKTTPGLSQMPLGLMIHPSFHSAPLLHPFMAAMGPGCHGYCVLAGVAKPWMWLMLPGGARSTAERVHSCISVNN